MAAMHFPLKYIEAGIFFALGLVFLWLAALNAWTLVEGLVRWLRKMAQEASEAWDWLDELAAAGYKALCYKVELGWALAMWLLCGND